MPSIKVGGVERTLLNILSELGNRDYRVTLLTSELPHEFESQLPANVEIKMIGSSGSGPFFLKLFSPKSRTSLGTMRGLVKFFKVDHPDAVYSFQGSTVAVVARLLARSKCPLFVRESNTPSQSFVHHGAFKRKIKILLKRLLYSRANAVIAVSKGVANDLANSVKIARPKIRVIYNPTYTPDLIKKSNEDLDHKWLNSESSVPVIISIGRLSRQKDHLTLIEAFKLVREKQEVRLIIVGEGAERSSIQ